MQIIDHYTSVFSVLGIICEDTVFVSVVIEYIPIMIECMNGIQYYCKKF